MQDHLHQHSLDERAQYEHARQERLAKQARRQNTNPNRLLMAVGEALVEAGERLQETAHNRVGYAYD